MIVKFQFTSLFLTPNVISENTKEQKNTTERQEKQNGEPGSSNSMLYDGINWVRNTDAGLYNEILNRTVRAAEKAEIAANISINAARKAEEERRKAAAATNATDNG